VVLAVIFCSGAAALAYQMTWVRFFSAGLGHEVPAIVSVTVAFLGGMALGAAVLDRRIATSPRPQILLARLEFIIGGWGLVSAILIPRLNRLALQQIGENPTALWHWTIVFILPLVALLPSTMAIGATLPAMERCFRLLCNDERCIGAVYSANTAGAVVGTLAATFALMPVFGLPGTLIVLTGINITVGIIALRLRATTTSMTGATSSGDNSTRLSPFRIHLTVFASGLLGMAVELASIRGLAQVLENTAYTYAAVLAVFLAGLAAGAAFFHRFLRHRPARQTLNGLICSLTVACLGIGWALRAAPAVYSNLRDLLGDTVAGVMLAEVTTAMMVLALPTIAMGATFSVLLQTGRHKQGGIGRMAAWNMLGCCVGIVSLTLWILPSLGLRQTLLVLALAYLPLLALRWKTEWWQPAIPLCLAFFFPQTLQLIRLPDDAEIIAQREGVFASVAVVKTPDGHRSLRVNNRQQMGSTSSAVAQRREAHLPLLLHPQPRTALFFGPGTGITLGATEAYNDLQVTAVELLPEVVDLMRYFEPENHGPFPRQNLHLQVADARRFIRTTTNRYDVIVADLFHPSQDGAGFLYTRDHFEAVRQRLNQDGIFCQWLPLHQLDATTLGIITRTFTEVFLETKAFLLHFNVDIPVLGLIGSRESLRLDPANVDRRLSQPRLRAALREAGLDRSINILGCFAGGPKYVRNFRRDAVVATDMNPAVLFTAPRFSYHRDAPTYAVLFEWLTNNTSIRDELLQASALPPDSDYGQRLTEFVAARDHYLHGLVQEDAGNLQGAIDVYLESSRRSLYFIPAYARMVTIIQAMAQADPARARELWRRLETVRPDQPLGRQLLAPLLNEPSAQPSAVKE
jgi:spermidine synthase